MARPTHWCALRPPRRLARPARAVRQHRRGRCLVAVALVMGYWQWLPARLPAHPPQQGHLLRCPMNCRAGAGTSSPLMRSASGSTVSAAGPSARVIALIHNGAGLSLGCRGPQRGADSHGSKRSQAAGQAVRWLARVLSETEKDRSHIQKQPLN